MTTKGTKEWADTNVNLIQGCSNNCQYCYAKKMAIRFKRKTEESWPIMEIDWTKVNKRYKRRHGRIMFPTSHDICGDKETIGACLIVLRKILGAGNQVLITTKPRLAIIKQICNEFKEFKSQIKFRFTITSTNDEILGFWEPDAPRFSERFESLKHAATRGYACSVSMEPFLDKDPSILFWKCHPYIQSFWIGPMNHHHHATEIYSSKHLKRIYLVLNDQPKIRFKDAFYNKMGAKHESLQM